MISVILPIYNKENYIEKCLDSILNQDYKDLQVIMVNDGSVDKTEEICKRYLSDDRFELVNQTNKGVSAARNAGMDIAKGEWIAFIDPDDYIEPNYFSRLHDLTEEKMDIVACCCKVIYPEQIATNLFYEKDITAVSVNKKKVFYKQLMNVFYGQPQNAVTAIGVPWGKLYRRSYIEKYHIRFHNDLKRMQDNIFNMYAFDKANGIKYVNEPLYMYRVDNINNYIFTKYNGNMMNNFEIFHKERRKFFNKNHYWNDDEIRKFYYRELFGHAVYTLNSQTLNKYNKSSHGEKRKELKKISKNSCFTICFHKLKITDIGGTARKVIFVGLKYRIYPLLFFIWSFRNIHLKKRIRREKG